MSTTQNQIKLHPSWKNAIGQEFDKPYMRQLREFLAHEKQLGKTIYPKGNEYFNAMNFTPFDKVKVVILGQDPYHGPGQAHGLCFSVKPEIPAPRSLVNIFKEIKNDLNIMPAKHGCLTSWAEQGVLLLNSVLTVQQGIAASHQGKGWEIFTDSIIAQLNEQRSGLVFLLWGNYAKAKGAIINKHRQLVLESAHPSPLSASRGFFNCRHFSKTNNYLKQQGLEEIDWRLP